MGMPSGPREHDVARGSGRTLRVLEDGDLEGKPVFVLHGTPGSRLIYSKHVLDAKRRGLRLIGYDRPGYGGSTPHPGRRIVDAAADVAAIADDLGIERFAVWGHSGGGAPALACAAALPDRVVAAACLASTAPYPASGIDWFEGMGELNVTDWKLMLSDRAAWEAKLVQDVAEMIHAEPHQLSELMATLLSEVDRAAMTPELAGFLSRQVREGLKPGAAGLRDDNLWDAAPWGFELSAIRVPLQLWHGRHDRFVPYPHGRWLAERLPQAELHLSEEEGHVTLYERRIPEVQGWLGAHFS
jgi:pimeloyl-ACP methyl ester carboxylesterase